jgi:hypothetical protein
MCFRSARQPQGYGHDPPLGRSMRPTVEVPSNSTQVRSRCLVVLSPKSQSAKAIAGIDVATRVTRLREGEVRATREPGRGQVLGPDRTRLVVIAYETGLVRPGWLT